MIQPHRAKVEASSDMPDQANGLRPQLGWVAVKRTLPLQMSDHVITVDYFHAMKTRIVRFNRIDGAGMPTDLTLSA